MERTVDQDNELARAQQVARMRERAQMFREVFGTPEKLTKHGQFILDSLHVTFGRGLPKNMLDDHGRTDMWQTARRLGHYDVIESIYDTLKWKENHEHPSKPSAK